MRDIDTEIIPAINASTFDEVADKLTKTRGEARWVHIDVADGTFAKNVLWHHANDLEEFRIHAGILPNIEVHLMIENPEAAIADWIRAGAKRIIVHAETMKDFNGIKRMCDEARVFFMIAIAPDTPASFLNPYFDKNIVGFQVLSVHPGVAGQLFIESGYDKIRYIREKCPWCDIEVDGGVKAGVAKKCTEAGANLFVSASAIFNAKTIKQGVDDLKADISLE